jgi:hypothetical protein
VVVGGVNVFGLVLINRICVFLLGVCVLFLCKFLVCE